ncbi:lipopolysaccharide biosynthesis protein [Buttiauxella izardii]|uniref:Lipopolysaccharide biosynthesis protein n=2 Tax=Buttiauxella izardii TaxID=82991 RepID=A0A3A5JTD9_9ENTR|nr:lipopolysaccharide biosynthesis protein [Buttiauxella izardii]
MLYFRMLLTMAVSLYTSRVILQTLGVDDFGIYNVVAGFVTMLGFLHGAMSSATQRFLAFELGKSEDKDVRSIFSMSMNIHVSIALFVLLIGETVGLWFVQTHLTIPADRVYAAEWVFHLALFSFMITIVSVPYNALIIAHERMSVFAWVSIIDVMLKLLIVFILGSMKIDKLILYGSLSLVVSFIICAIYATYCTKIFSESKFRIYWDQKLFRIMLSYTGWNLWGNIAAVISGQGINILLNIFFGPSVNAARAIAMLVSSALNNFVQSLQVAINPQIIKSYASQDMAYMHKLVCYGAKYNFFLLFFLSMPVIINTDVILNSWLGSTPEYTSIFVRLIIANILVDCISAPLMTSVQATGKIKLYQSIVGGVLLLNLPLSYFILKTGGQPQTVIYVGITISVVAFLVRLVILKKITFLPVVEYLREVVLRSVLIIIAVIALYYATIYFLFDTLGFWCGSTLISIYCLLAITSLGLEPVEREFIFKKLKFILFTLSHRNGC